MIFSNLWDEKYVRTVVGVYTVKWLLQKITINKLFILVCQANYDGSQHSTVTYILYLTLALNGVWKRPYVFKINYLKFWTDKYPLVLKFWLIAFSRLGLTAHFSENFSSCRISCSQMLFKWFWFTIKDIKSAPRPCLMIQSLRPKQCTCETTSEIIDWLLVVQSIRHIQSIVSLGFRLGLPVMRDAKFASKTNKTQVFNWWTYTECPPNVQWDNW